MIVPKFLQLRLSKQLTIKSFVIKIWKPPCNTYSISLSPWRAWTWLVQAIASTSATCIFVVCPWLCLDDIAKHIYIPTSLGIHLWFDVHFEVATTWTLYQKAHSANSEDRLNFFTFCKLFNCPQHFMFFNISGWIKLYNLLYLHRVQQLPRTIMYVSVTYTLNSLWRFGFPYRAGN